MRRSLCLGAPGWGERQPEAAVDCSGSLCAYAISLYVKMCVMSCLPLAGDCLLAIPVAAPSHMQPRVPIATTLPQGGLVKLSIRRGIGE